MAFALRGKQSERDEDLLWDAHMVAVLTTLTLHRRQLDNHQTLVLAGSLIGGSP
jgi:hypothetical protein